MRALIFVILISLVACAPEPFRAELPPAPEGLLNQEKFTQVMMDVQLLEATLKLKLIRKDDINDRVMGYYQQIWEKHNITEQQYRENLTYYVSQVEVIAEIYDSLEVRISREKGRIDSLKETKDVLDNLEKKRLRSK